MVKPISHVTKSKAQGPARERASTGTAGGAGRGCLEPRGVDCDLAADGIERRERGGGGKAIAAKVWHAACPGAGGHSGFAKSQRHWARQGGDPGGRLCPGAENGGRAA